MKRNGNAADAAYLSEARTTLGLSQPEMGRALGLSQSAVSHIENGWTPLADPTRRDVERLLARKAARIILGDEGGWDRGVAPCAEFANLRRPLSLEMFHAHTETCGVCLARAALLMMQSTARAVAGVRP